MSKLSTLQNILQDALGRKLTFVFGDYEYFTKFKTIWQTQPITQKAINYNIEKHKHFKNLASDLRFPQEIRERANRYAKTFLLNALKLKQGKK
jgi:hypothetical protein